MHPTRRLSRMILSRCHARAWDLCRVIDVHATCVGQLALARRLGWTHSTGGVGQPTRVGGRVWDRSEAGWLTRRCCRRWALWAWLPDRLTAAPARSHPSSLLAECTTSAVAQPPQPGKPTGQSANPDASSPLPTMLVWPFGPVLEDTTRTDARNRPTVLSFAVSAPACLIRCIIPR